MVRLYPISTEGMKFLVSPFLIGSYLLLSGWTFPADTHTQEIFQPLISTNATSPETTTTLIGTWEVRDHETDQAVTLIFAETGQLLLIIPTDDGTPAAISMGYTINMETNPGHIDLILNEEQTAFSLFEITPEQNLRIQLDSILPGEPRPETLSETATTFTKVSEDTTLAEDVEIVNLEAPSQQPDIAVQYIIILSRAQQAFYAANNRFASSLEELGIAAALETELYRYELITPRSSQSVAIVAQPKQTGLPSYIGAVFVKTVALRNITVAGVCQSNSPSFTPPTFPTPPQQDHLQIQCPAGSSLIQ